VFLAEPTAVPAGTTVAPSKPEVLLDLVAGGREVVLVSTDARGEAAARAARFAAGSGQVGLLPLTAPPTLVFVLAAVAALVPDFALGYLPNVFARAGYYSRTFAALGSVRGLRHPQVSRSLMTRSTMPGGTYVVDWQKQAVSASKVIEVPQHVWAVSASSPHPPAVSWGGWPSQQPVMLTCDDAFWGTSRWLEATVVSQVPRAIIGTLFDFIPPDAVQCRSCARVCGGEVCVFCQVQHFDSSAPHDSSGFAMDTVGL